MNIRLILPFSVFQLFLSICVNGQVDYNKKLDEFYEKYREKLKRDGKIKSDKEFSIDGLLLRPAGENKGGKESLYWENSHLRVLLLLKDNNGNDGANNSREYEHINNPFGRNIAAWIYGFFEIYSGNDIPELYEAYNATNQCEAFTKKPFAIVNIKKKVGKESVSDSEVKKFASEYKKLIRKDIGILKPNVIVCCGGSNGAVLQYAKEIIFPKSEYNFVQYGTHGLIYYDAKKNLMLIRSYHPSAWRVSRNQIYTNLMEDFHKCVSLLKK